MVKTPEEERTLRRDAQRKKELLIAAAREVFAESGLGAPMEAVARRAGVGSATLHRRFPTREALTEVVYADVSETISAACEEALALDDGFTGLHRYLELHCRLFATNRGACDLIMLGFPTSSTALEATRRYARETVRTLVERAQAEETLRADATLEDVLLMVSSLLLIIPALGTAAPDAWRRSLAMLLDGLRSGTSRPQPQPPLTPDQFTRTIAELRTAARGRIR